MSTIIGLTLKTGDFQIDRALVEHVFGFMENSMNGIFLRCIGLKRAACQIGLANMVYNMCRYSQLIRLGRIKAA
ncbi:MAG: hypothetical protein ACKOEZ_12150 [Spartobacteria bacterium]